MTIQKILSILLITIFIYSNNVMYGMISLHDAVKKNDLYTAEASWGRKINSYKLIRQNNKLVIDGIVCRFDGGEEIKFNW